jgi:1-acyl-sn-glycerol-3-phosphate acyltransferase
MYLRTCFVLALLATVGLCAAGMLAWYWAVPFALFAFALLLAVSVIFLFIVSLFCYGKKPIEKDNLFCRFLAYHTMDSILALFRFRAEGKGLEQIPEEPCVIVCNHLSRFDPMVKFRLMKGRRLAFVSKKENMRLIVGPVTKKIGFVPLDRENPLRAMRSIRAAAKLVSDFGFTMGIYPEGTRSRTGELLEYKTGAFVMAKKANAPVVISRIEGTDKYKGRFPWRTTRVTYEVLEVLSKEQVKEKSPEELASYCRSVTEKGMQK